MLRSHKYVGWITNFYQETMLISINWNNKITREYKFEVFRGFFERKLHSKHHQEVSYYKTVVKDNLLYVRAQQRIVI